jgi:hypothetical protein
MGFPLEVVGASKQKITCRSHIKYADNMDLKTKTDDLDGKISKSYAVLKKMALKTDLRCESYAILKKGINGNQGTRGSVSCFIKLPTFIKRSGDHFYKEKLHAK